MEEIRSRCERRAREGWRPSFAIGERVEITNGPFVGLEAIFDSLPSPAGRSRVFLEFLSRLVPVEVDADCLRRAG